MTVYSTLIALGYTDEQIRATRHASSREFTVAVADTPDGDPLVGIVYSCDFRAEEEWGVASLRAALTGAKENWQMSKPSEHATRFDDLPHSLILSTRNITEPRLWGRDLKMGTGQWDAVTHGSKDAKQPYAEHYDVHWTEYLSHAQGRPPTWSLRWKTVPELRQMAADGGVEKIPRLKADLIEAISKLGNAETPDVWPGWFHHGDTLILRADEGIVGDVLDLLHFAATHRGTLAFGGGRQVFGSGLAFYDGADVGPKLKKEREQQARWTAKHEKALEPVKKELTKRGFSWLHLGGPREIDGEVKYWLNGSGHPQAYGWYSLKELLAEKFVADIEAKKK